ncbi:MAG: cation transporter, partial [Chloroflexi bacterium]
MGELRVDGRPQAIALGSLVLGALLLIAKLVVGILTGSLGILSEAAHSALDVAASAFALVAVRTSRRPADQEHPYGHGRVENLAAYTEGLVLLVTALGLMYEAGRRLLAGAAQVDAASYAFILLIIAMAVEAGRGMVLRWAGRAAASQALTADAGNRWADVASALAVLAGLAGVRLGIPWADAVAALAVGAFIAFAAIRILLQAGDELMDRAPVGAEADLRRAIGAVPGVEEVRAVRVRRSGPRLLGDAHIATRRMLSVEGAQSLSEEVQGKVAEALPEVDLVLVVEG